MANQRLTLEVVQSMGLVTNISEVTEEMLIDTYAKKDKKIQRGDG